MQNCLHSPICVRARLQRLRKNPEEHAKAPKNVPQGLKPVLIVKLLTARLKSCPDASCLPDGVFPLPLKPNLILLLFRHDSSRALALLVVSTEFCKWLLTLRIIHLSVNFTSPPWRSLASRAVPPQARSPQEATRTLPDAASHNLQELVSAGYIVNTVGINSRLHLQTGLRTECTRTSDTGILVIFEELQHYRPDRFRAAPRQAPLC